MNLATVSDGCNSVRVGTRICIRRTDGSNRIDEGVCTDVHAKSIGVLSSNAVFVVGEVVELAFDGQSQEIGRPRARVLHRTSNRYGLRFLAD